MPPISLTTDESSERTDIITEVNTYITETKMKFIIGAESLDNYDKYLAQINALGLPRAVEITQGALNRYMEK